MTKCYNTRRDGVRNLGILGTVAFVGSSTVPPVSTH